MNLSKLNFRNWILVYFIGFGLKFSHFLIELSRSFLTIINYIMQQKIHQKFTNQLRYFQYMYLWREAVPSSQLMSPLLCPSKQIITWNLFIINENELLFHHLYLSLFFKEFETIYVTMKKRIRNRLRWRDLNLCPVAFSVLENSMRRTRYNDWLLSSANGLKKEENLQINKSA